MPYKNMSATFAMCYTKEWSAPPKGNADHKEQ